MPICPFCRKSVDPNTVWCTCGINLSRYPNLPTATAEIKVWLAKYEPESLGSSQPEGSLLELARRNLIDEQETEVTKKTRNTGELSEARKLIDDFLSDCQRAGLAPTIDIGQLRRDRWRQWRRIPTEYRQNPPVREFRLTPGYLFETNVAKFQDEFCLAIDGTVYKHQLNAPDPFPLEELLNQVPLNKLAEGLTFSLVWLLKAKQQPEAIDEKAAATGRKREPDAEPAGKRTGFRLPFGRGKGRETEPPVPFPIPTVEEFDSPVTASAAAVVGAASAGAESIAVESAKKLEERAKKPSVKADAPSADGDAGPERTDARGVVTAPPAVEEEVGAQGVAKRNKKLGLRLPFGRAKVESTPPASPAALQTAATNQTAEPDISSPPVKTASRFKLPFSFKKAAAPESGGASRQESASSAGSAAPAAEPPVATAKPATATADATTAKSTSVAVTTTVGGDSETAVETSAPAASAPVEPANAATSPMASGPTKTAQTPTASAPKKAEPEAAVNKKAATAVEVAPGQITDTTKPVPAPDVPEKDLKPPFENDDGPIVAPLKSQKAEDDKKSFWPWSRKKPAARAESDEGETKKGLKLPFGRGKKADPTSASTPTAELPIASVHARAPAIETKTPAPESMTAATGVGIDIEKPEPDEQAVTSDKTIEVKTVASTTPKTIEEPAPTDEIPKLEEAGESKSNAGQETPVVGSTKTDKSAGAAPVPDEHGVMIYTKRSAPKSSRKWPFGKPKTDSTASPTTPANETAAKAPAAPVGPQASVSANAEMAAEPPATPAAKQPATVTVSTPPTAPKNTATAGPPPTADSRVARKEASEEKRRGFWPFGRKAKDPESTTKSSAGETPKPMAPKATEGAENLIMAEGAPKPVAGAGRPSPSSGMAPDPSAGAPKPVAGPKPGPQPPRSSAGARVGAPRPGAETAPRPNPSAVRPNPGPRPNSEAQQANTGASVGAPRPGVGAPRPGAGANASARGPAPTSGIRPPGARPAMPPSNQAPAARQGQTTEPKGKRWFWPFGGKQKEADGTAAPSTATAPKPPAPRPGPGAPRSGAGTAPRTAPGAQKPMAGAIPNAGTNAGAPRPRAAGAPTSTPQRLKPEVSAPRPPETTAAPKRRPNTTATPGTSTGPAETALRPQSAPTEPALQEPATKTGGGNGEGREPVSRPEQTKS